MGTTMTSPASLYKDILITPATAPIIRAYNARTGAEIWKFDLVAQPGDPNNKTWEGESWKAIGESGAKLLAGDLDAAMESLPERCRLVMQLRWREQLSYAEIAEVMQISVKGVENQLARGLAALRRRLL